MGKTLASSFPFIGVLLKKSGSGNIWGTTRWWMFGGCGNSKQFPNKAAQQLQHASISVVGCLSCVHAVTPACLLVLVPLPRPLREGRLRLCGHLHGAHAGREKRHVAPNGGDAILDQVKAYRCRCQYPRRWWQWPRGGVGRHVFFLTVGEQLTLSGEKSGRGRVISKEKDTKLNEPGSRQRLSLKSVLLPPK